METLSPYLSLCALFLLLSGGMKEQDLMCIKLHGVNKIGLKKIIDFIYTAKLSLNMDNLQDTLEAASFLQILPVLDFCKVFLISGVRLVSCLQAIKAFRVGCSLLVWLALFVCLLLVLSLLLLWIR